MTASDYIDDVASVGGKSASLGELCSALSQDGMKVPEGFAITAQAHCDALAAAGAWTPLHQLLDGLNKSDVELQAKRAAAARKDRLRLHRLRGAPPANFDRLTGSEEAV